MPIYQEIYYGPARSYRRDGSGSPVTSRKKYITIHNTSNDATAEGEASYAMRRTDGTSSHYYVDHDSIVQSLNTDWCAGHVGSAQGNTYGISYEITGVNGWTREQWLSDVAWQLLAKQIAVDCVQFGISVRQLSIAEMRAGAATGFITHDQARLAWGGTTHTDPGPNFPMDHLLALVADLIGDDDMSLDEPIGADYAPPGYGQHKVRTALGYSWRAANEAMVGVARIEAQLKLIGEKVDLDPAELEAVKAAAEAGARAGALASVDELVAAFVAALPEDVASRDDVVSAVREVLAGARIVVAAEG